MYRYMIYIYISCFFIKNLYPKRSCDEAQRQANRAAAEVEGQRAAGQLASRAKGGGFGWINGGFMVDQWSMVDLW